jgi:hypothetical protein
MFASSTVLGEPVVMLRAVRRRLRLTLPFARPCQPTALRLYDPPTVLVSKVFRIFESEEEADAKDDPTRTVPSGLIDVSVEPGTFSQIEG